MKKSHLISQQYIHVVFRVVLLSDVMIIMQMFMGALSKAELKKQQYQKCRGCHLLSYNTLGLKQHWN